MPAIRFLHRPLTFLCLLALATLPLTAGATATVVVSIKPLELLVRAVGPEDLQISTLVAPGASPHNYSLKPSERKALAEADRIFWMGPALETFLARLLSGEDFQGRVVTLGDPDAEAHDDHDHHHHHHGDDEDPHLWVDPQLSLDMAHTIANELGKLAGVDAEEVAQNLARFERELKARERRIQAELSEVSTVDVFAYHNALTRFAEHYDVPLAGVLTLNPEVNPGARRLAEVQNQLRAAQAPCLLTEPQFNPRWWRAITEGMDLRLATWDPLATDIESTPRGYLEFQQSIADAIRQCLPEQTQH